MGYIYTRLFHEAINDRLKESFTRPGWAVFKLVKLSFPLVGIKYTEFNI